MTRRELKERLDAMLDALPEDKASLLLEFADFLSHQAQADQMTESASEPENGWEPWERGVIAAEEYWFGLPETTRRSYGVQTVAVVVGRILDTDVDTPALTARVQSRYPEQPVLYIEATAERLPTLALRSPRLG